MNIIDISNDLLTAEVYQGDPVPELERVKKLGEGSAYNLSVLSACLHNGTHADAPLHFLEDGCSVDEYALEKFIGPCKVITMSPGIITGQAVEEYFPRDCSRILIKSSGRAFLHYTAAEVLSLYGYELVGTDANSIESDGEDGRTHRTLLSHDIAILEGLNLSGVETGEYFLIAPPVKISEAEASFTRALLISDYIFWSKKGK